MQAEGCRLESDLSLCLTTLDKLFPQLSVRKALGKRLAHLKTNWICLWGLEFIVIVMISVRIMKVPYNSLLSGMGLLLIHRMPSVKNALCELFHFTLISLLSLCFCFCFFIKNCFYDCVLIGLDKAATSTNIEMLSSFVRSSYDEKIVTECVFTVLHRLGRGISSCSTWLHHASLMM